MGIFMSRPLSDGVEREVIEFCGVRYFRYPSSKHVSARRYFKRGGNNKRGKELFLHRAIWASIHGEIPKGFHVHHKDGDFLNNSLENLACVSRKEHFSEHLPALLSILKSQKQKEHLKSIRVQASAWHRSSEGRAWHSKNQKEVMKRCITVKISCAFCRKEKTIKKFSLRDRNYCDWRCRYKHLKDL